MAAHAPSAGPPWSPSPVPPAIPAFVSDGTRARGPQPVTVAPAPAPQAYPPPPPRRD